MISTSIIVPTYNRPESLKECILSILEQTVMPNEIIIIDDGNLSGIPCINELSEAGVNCRYFKKDVPGLTESRNTGVKLSTGDILCFLDDDVVLFPNYLEEILGIYYQDEGEDIAGVGGLIANIPPLKWYEYIRNMYYIVFLNKGIKEGRVLKSGFCTELGITEFRLNHISRVDFLSGGVSSYRRKIFEEFSFTDKFREHALGEDKDFSLRVSKKYRLVVNPQAKLFHYNSTEMRPDKRERGEKFVIGKYLIFKNLIKKRWWDWIFFYYALFGYVLIHFSMALVLFDRSEWGRIAGFFSAMKNIWSGNVLINE